MESKFNISISPNVDSSLPSTATAIDQEKEGVMRQKLMNQLCELLTPLSVLLIILRLAGLGYLDQSIMSPVMEKLLYSSEAYSSIAKSGSLSVLYEIGE
jgi:hypothetical protein